MEIRLGWTLTIIWESVIWDVQVGGITKLWYEERYKNNHILRQKQCNIYYIKHIALKIQLKMIYILNQLYSNMPICLIRKLYKLQRRFLAFDYFPFLSDKKKDYSNKWIKLA